MPRAVVAVAYFHITLPLTPLALRRFLSLLASSSTNPNNIDPESHRAISLPDVTSDKRDSAINGGLKK
jgi:hypothetical protein